MNHDENRKRMFRRVRNDQMGKFFDLNDEPPDLGKPARVSAHKQADLIRQQTPHGVSYSGIIMTSNMTFNPRRR